MKKIIITEHEVRNILNQHISKGYKTTLNEQGSNNPVEVMRNFIQRLESAGSGVGIEYAFTYLSNNVKGNTLDEVLEKLENEMIGGKSGLSKYLDSKLGFNNLEEIENINNEIMDAGANHNYTYTLDGTKSVKNIKFQKSTQKQKDTMSSIEKSTQKQKDTMSPIEKSTQKQKDTISMDKGEGYRNFSKLLGKNFNDFIKDKYVTYFNYDSNMSFIQDGVEYVIHNTNNKYWITLYDEKPFVEDYELLIKKVSNTNDYELFAKLDNKIYSLEELFDLDAKFIESEEQKYNIETVEVKKGKKLKIVVPENKDYNIYVDNGRKVRPHYQYKTIYYPTREMFTNKLEIEDFDIDNRAINIYISNSHRKNMTKEIDIAIQIFGENHLVHNFTNKEMVQKIYQFGERLNGDGIDSLIKFNDMMYNWQQRFKGFNVNEDLENQTIDLPSSIWYHPGQCLISPEIQFNYEKGRYEIDVLSSYEIGWPSGIDAQLDKGIGAEFLKHTKMGIPPDSDIKAYNEWIKRGDELMAEYQKKMGICYNPSYGDNNYNYTIIFVNRNDGIE